MTWVEVTDVGVTSIFSEVRVFWKITVTSAELIKSKFVPVSVSEELPDTADDSEIEDRVGLLASSI